MSEQEARGSRAFYDHELEDGHATGRRRRPAADWGVGEELFDHMPSRRRFRPSDAGARHESPRRDAHEPPRDPRPRTGARTSADYGRSTDELDLGPAREAAAPAQTPGPGSAVDAAWMAELAERAMLAGEAAPAVEDDRPASAIDAVEPPGAARRTVVIRGRGAEPAGLARRDRRPPRSVGERLGPRPDRVAAWAVALGMLLILIAILTAN